LQCKLPSHLQLEQGPLTCLPHLVANATLGHLSTPYQSFRADMGNEQRGKKGAVEDEMNASLPVGKAG